MRFRALGFLQVFLVFLCFAITPNQSWSSDHTDPHAVFFKDVQTRLLEEGFNQDMIERLYGKQDVHFDVENVSFFSYTAKPGLTMSSSPPGEPFAKPANTLRLTKRTCSTQKQHTGSIRR